MVIADSTLFFFFNDPAPPEIYPLSLHDALPISSMWRTASTRSTTTKGCFSSRNSLCRTSEARDRKSTRLNSSHLVISYAVFCLKKKTLATVRHRQELLDYGISTALS